MSSAIVTNLIFKILKGEMPQLTKPLFEYSFKMISIAFTGDNADQKPGNIYDKEDNKCGNKSLEP